MLTVNLKLMLTHMHTYTHTYTPLWEKEREVNIFPIMNPKD